MSTIGQSWMPALGPETKKPYFKELITFLEKEVGAGKNIYPPGWCWQQSCAHTYILLLLLHHHLLLIIINNNNCSGGGLFVVAGLQSARCEGGYSRPGPVPRPRPGAR